MKTNIEYILKEELLKQEKYSLIFKNEKFFSKSYFPSMIKFRDKEFYQLSLYFRDLLKLKEKSVNFFQTVTLVGPVGCGKSSVAKIFGTEIEKVSKNTLNIKLIYRQINCRRNNSIYLILFDLMKSLVPHFPNRGFSSIELLNMLQILLTNSNSYLILTLDEIDFIFHDRELDLFFQNLSMETSELKFLNERRISLIFITKNKDFLLLIDPNNKFGIINNIIRFSAYSTEELKQILFEKALNGFKEGVLPIQTLDFVSIISQELGDLRIALELLWRSGKNSEKDNSDIIMINHIKNALSSILFINNTNNSVFNEHEKSLLSCFVENKNIFFTSQSVDVKLLKKIFNDKYINDISKLEDLNLFFENAIQKLTSMGILFSDTSNKNRDGNTNYILKISPSLVLQTI
jgi:Cdc6-like AAA superfamily ATPase